MGKIIVWGIKKIGPRPLGGLVRVIEVDNGPKSYYV